MDFGYFSLTDGDYPGLDFRGRRRMFIAYWRIATAKGKVL